MDKEYRQTFDDNEEEVCVVCFRTVDIYSIGECNHPVCHECSTRMRVLCCRTECPICRKDMAMVIFTTTINNFSSFQYRNMNCERRYVIHFENDIVMKAYDELLEHRCDICTTNPQFRTFNDLKDHKKKMHEQFYCELCVDNLKIFTMERRSYSRQNLAQHRRKGDTDDKSHKGHPNCEFCETRFMDIDELFRHLRKDHYFCHFCDADGLHQYYDDYNALRKHFISDHFLCDEGICAEERFTSVFRSKMDYQAHFSQMHGHLMSKAQSKQARIVDIEFSVNHRQAQYSDRNTRGGRGGRRNDNEEQEAAAGAVPPSMMVQVPSTRSIDINCSQDFPSLGKMALTLEAESGANRSIAQKLAQQSQFTIRMAGGRALNNHVDFPSLGQSVSSNSTSTSVHLSVNGTAASKAPHVSIQYNSTQQPKRVKPHGDGNSVKVTTGTKPKNSFVNEDFPSLQTKTSTPEKIVTSNWGTNSHIKVGKLSTTAPAPKPPPPKAKGKIFESDDFPTLGPSAVTGQPLLNYSGRSSLTIPVKKVNSIKSNENEENVNSRNKKKKKNISGKSVLESNMNNQNKSQPKKKPFTLNNIFDDIDPSAPIEDYTKGKLGEYESFAPVRLSNVRCISSLDEGTVQKQQTVIDAVVPPSVDFTAKDFPSLGGRNSKDKKSNKSSAPLNGSSRNHSNKKKSADTYQSRPPNVSSSFSNTNMTFTSNLGQNFAIPSAAESSATLKLKNTTSCIITKKDTNVNSFQSGYLLPPDFSERNKALINTISGFCDGSADKFNKFKHLAANFRNGNMKGQEYYEKCRQVMGKNIFLNVLPELLALLPDISKQQAVLEAFNKLDSGRNSDAFFAVCANCQQVLIAEDFSEHMLSHDQIQEEQFPSLQPSGSIHRY